MDEVTAPVPAPPPRVMLITPGDGRVAVIERVVRAAARGGVDAVLVREPLLQDGELVRLVERVLAAVTCAAPPASPHSHRGTVARVLVSERFDVALAAGADGVHLKSRGLDPREVRDALAGRAPAGFLVGLSTHAADELAAASRSGAVDYCCLGPVHATGPGKTPLELTGLARLLSEARRAGPLVPYLALGGVIPADGRALASLAASGERWGLGAIRPYFEAESDEDVERVARAFCDATS